MTTVHARTDQLGGLQELIEERRARGLDTYDYWADGEYVVVPGPSLEHGEMAVELAVVLKPPARARGLRYSAPANIGRDRQDCRIPDIAFFRPGARRTSPAFLAEAELVVEILSPEEERDAKLDFYAAWGVREYLEVDWQAQRLRLLRREGLAWVEQRTSAVLGVTVDDLAAQITWPAPYEGER